MALAFEAPLKTPHDRGYIAVDLSRLAVTPVTPALYKDAGNGESKVEVAKVKRREAAEFLSLSNRGK
jgi:hypothetical protein